MNIMLRPLVSFVAGASFLSCAAACVLWATTAQRGVSVARYAFESVEYRLITGHGVAQLAAVPFVRPTASPFSSKQMTRLGCTLSRWTIEGRAGWAFSVPLSYLVLVLSLLPLMRLAQWSRRKRRQQYNPALCPNCGYDLRVGHERCPECGSRITSTVGRIGPTSSPRPL